jgi:hypothetical protein
LFADQGCTSLLAEGSGAAARSPALARAAWLAAWIAGAAFFHPALLVFLLFLQEIISG